MDYKDLLLKYMAHVIGCESIDYLDRLNDRTASDVKFSEQEIAELEKISSDAEKLAGC